MRQSLVKRSVQALADCNAHKLGLDKGLAKWYNFYTIRGRHVVFVVCGLMIYSVVKVSAWKYNRPFVAEAKRQEQAKRDLFERQVQAWVANGKKFE